MNDFERKETKSGSSDTSPIEGVTDDNMSNDTQNHSYANRKDGRRIYVPENRKDEFDDAIKKDKKHTNEITDWENGVDGVNISNDLQTYADAIRKDEVQLDKAVAGNNSKINGKRPASLKLERMQLKKVAESHGGIN